MSTGGAGVDGTSRAPGLGRGTCDLQHLTLVDGPTSARITPLLAAYGISPNRGKRKSRMLIKADERG